MSKVIMYLAMSLDGKISGPDHDVAWLEEIPNPDQSDFGYTSFISGISTTLMGRTTYEWVKQQAVPWPYTSTDNYVFTTNQAYQDNDEVSFVKEDHWAFLRSLKASAEKDIWLIGGAKLNLSCLAEGLIDEVIVNVMPVLLGEGTTLFEPPYERQWLHLIESKNHGQAIELRYEVKK